jgi:hypothetical protein
MTALSGDLGVNEIIRILGLAPHPEGGWFVETFRAPAPQGARASCTAIYFLLGADQVSAWHKVDATEIWLWQAGAPLALTRSLDGIEAASMQLGPDLRAGQRPQGVIPDGAWQSAESLGAWTLVSCVVAPGFEFSGFELAPQDWRPGPGGAPPG